MLSPAWLRLPSVKMCWNSDNEILCRPKSMSVPTVARTMLRRNRLAVISKYHSCAAVCTHWQVVTSQSVVLLSPPLLQKAAKSRCASSSLQPSFIRLKSSGKVTSSE